MATIIDCGDGRFIAGDPDTELHEGNHWCGDCGGSGLEYDWDGDLTICLGCDGVGQTVCTDRECPEHGDRVPQGPTAPTWEQADELFDVYMRVADATHEAADAHEWELYEAMDTERQASRATWRVSRAAYDHARTVGGFAGQPWCAGVLVEHDRA